MRKFKAMLLLPLLSISASCSTTPPVTASSPPPISPTIPTYRSVSCADLWLIYTHLGPDDGQHDQLTGSTIKQIEHNNGFIIARCGSGK